jgi:hypothetical protein
MMLLDGVVGMSTVLDVYSSGVRYVACGTAVLNNRLRHWDSHAR